MTKDTMNNVDWPQRDIQYAEKKNGLIFNGEKFDWKES